MYNKKWSNKAYGIFFAIVFIILSFIPLLNKNSISISMLLVALIFVFISFFTPKLLNPLIIIWDWLGKILFTIFNPIILFILYFTLITPLGILFKIINRKIIIKDFKTHQNSYWVKRKEIIQNMKKQF